MSEPLNDVASGPRRTWRRWFWRWMFRAGCIVLGVAVWIASRWTPPEKLAISPSTTHVVESLTAEGNVDFVAAINQSLHPCPLDENAFAVLFPIVDWDEDSAARELGRKLSAELGFDVPDRAADSVILSFEKYVKTLAIEDDDADRQFPAIVISEPWSAERHPLVSNWLDRNRPALSLIRAAGRRPGFYRPIVLGDDGLLISASVNDCQAYRVAVRALCARALRSCDSGEIEEAVADLQAAYQLGDWSGEYPWLITQLVEFSILAVTKQATYALIQSGKLTDETAAVLQSKLFASFDFVPVDRLLDGPARLLILQSYLENHLHRNQPVQQIMQGLGNGGLDWNLLLAEINLLYDEAVQVAQIDDPDLFTQECVRFHAKLVEMTEQPTVGMLRALFVSGRSGVSRRAGQAMGAMTLPKFDISVRLRRRYAVEKRLLVLALGLKRYHLAHRRFPERLSELSPGYLSLSGDEWPVVTIEYAVLDDGALLKVRGVNGAPAADADERSFADIEVKLDHPAAK